MAFSVLWASGLQRANASSSPLISLNQSRNAQRTGQEWGSQSSARTGADTYTPSQASWSAGALPSATSSSVLSATDPVSLGSGAAAAGSAVLPTVDFYAGIPQALAAGLASYQSPTQTAWQSLQQSLASGDISAAQTALTSYRQSLAASNDSMSALTTPSAQFMSDLTNLGSALSAGNLEGAQSAFQTAQGDQPPSLAQALATALATAAWDGAQNGNWMQDMVNFAATLTPGSTAPAAATASGSSGGASGSSADPFSTDLNNLEGLIQEANANVGDYLVTQGYTPGQVSADVSALNLSQSLGALPVVAQTIARLDGNSSTFVISSSIDLADATSTGNSISGSALMAAQTSAFTASGPIDAAITAASENINASSASNATSGGAGAGSAPDSGNASLLAYDFSIASTSLSAGTSASGAQDIQSVETLDSYAFSEASLTSSQPSSNPQNSGTVSGQGSKAGSTASTITEASFTSMTEIQTLLEGSYGAGNSGRNWNSGASSGVSQYA